MSLPSSADTSGAEDALMLPQTSRLAEDALMLPQTSRLFSYPGFSHAAAQSIGTILDINHKTYHCFFNDKGFHNHLAHHLLAVLSLGGGPSAGPRIYEHALATSLDPSFHLNNRPGMPSGITEDNWSSFVGSRAKNMPNYWPLLDFWDTQIRENGPAAVLERYIFSEAAQEEASMLSRFVGGALHPLIHAGYGAEFSLPGVLSEGLAMAAMTEKNWSPLFPSGWHDTIGPAANASDKTTASPSAPHAGLSVFTLAALIGADPALAPGTATKYTTGNKSGEILSNGTADKIAAHAARWIVTTKDVEDPDAITGKGGWWNKVEELAWLCVCLLGATSRPGKKLQHDFFLMHSHNAVLFLPSLLPLLSPSSRSKLLHALLRVTLLYWVARGRPVFHIADTLNASTETPRNPLLVDALPVLRRALDTSPSTSMASMEDVSAWPGLIEAAAQHGDEHLTKAVRTMAFFSSRLSAQLAGTLRLQDEVLEAEHVQQATWQGIEKLDGTAFVRTAGQYMETQGWRWDGESMLWSYEGPGFDEAWE